MPTSAAVVTRVRRFLDDFETSHRKGLEWSDNEIYLALNAAQFAVVRALFIKAQWHLISNLETTATSANPLTIPVNYMFAGSARIESAAGRLYPAVLYMGWSGREFDNDPTRYVAYVRNDTVTFRRGTTGATGELCYWKRPTQFTVATNHTEFIDSVYDMIIYHACAILQFKDLGACRRAIENLKAIMTTLMSEPMGMYPQRLNEGMDA